MSLPTQDGGYMEKKTIGSFISTLRKANGMTQKNLAEKLNVSDKTISRWERDEGAPDLTLIPVIAEVFGVTCDELLRGEKKADTSTYYKDEEEGYSAKGEKQKKWLVTSAMSRYKSKTTISVGIALLGFVFAMIMNFGFYRAKAGFFVALVFYIISIICQKIFNNELNLALFNDEDMLKDMNFDIEQNISQNMKKFYRIICFLVVIVLTLFLDAPGGYYCIDLFDWFNFSVVYLLLFAFLYILVHMFIAYPKKVIEVKNDKGDISEKQKKKFWYNHKLKKNCVYVLLPILFITLLAMFLCEFIPFFEPKRIVFDNYEDFVDYMETDIETYRRGNKYYEEYPEYEREFTDDDRIYVLNDINGDVVCKYADENNSVVDIDYEMQDGTVLPISVLTRKEVMEKDYLLFVKNIIFAGAIFAEILATVVVYYVKRKK